MVSYNHTFAFVEVSHGTLGTISGLKYYWMKTFITAVKKGQEDEYVRVAAQMSANHSCSKPFPTSPYCMLSLSTDGGEVCTEALFNHLLIQHYTCSSTPSAKKALFTASGSQDKRSPLLGHVFTSYELKSGLLVQQRQ